MANLFLFRAENWKIAKETRETLGFQALHSQWANHNRRHK